ncbi:hypothetical protein Kisp01_45470 [Kineosporia sp. NBRC 101677]|uniref:hypothetical protein n=1 Tax=Kineosporia sp. NBRC 101677 TaxID=3032197 RepID=UPI0024A1DEBA|nr:hypothetical protein [Kineosporia sp. NBRC 101677]GLY17533.1 hypothetical protein Kisp01_45470 [Kineosporia sp. NBRC 101677]
MPAAPQRVVCGDYFGAFALVDVGLVPVGVGGGGYESTGARYGDRLAGVLVTGDYTEPDVEKIAAAEPDLILRTSEANAVLDEYCTRTAAVRQKHAAVLAEHTFSFVQLATDTTFWTLGPAWTDTTVLLDCGLRLAEPSASQSGPTQEYSFEKIAVQQERVFPIVSGAASLGTGLQLAERIDQVLVRLAGA